MLARNDSIYASVKVVDNDLFVKVTVLKKQKNFAPNLTSQRLS